MISSPVIFDVFVRYYFHGAKKILDCYKKLAAAKRKGFGNGQLFIATDDRDLTNREPSPLGGSTGPGLKAKLFLF